MKYIPIVSLVCGLAYGVNWHGFFPVSNSVKIVSGYDSNVLRLSLQEKADARTDKNILGRAKTFDSAFIRFGYSLSSTYRLSHRGSYFRFSGDALFTDYTHTPGKSYWSARGSIIYQRKYHQRLTVGFHHLNRYYLRDYKNRDISSRIYEQCFFTDQSVSIIAMQPLTKKIWVNGGVEGLKRYYNPAFAEFDLDIYTRKLQVYMKPVSWLRTSVEYRVTEADNITYLKTARSSDFDRSYTSREVYVPVVFYPKSGYLTRAGMSYRQEKRNYIAESFDDPLHSGRNHTDQKFDVWFQKNLTGDVKVTFTLRYRIRHTESEYDWVGELKSFEQLQSWITITKGFIYDRY